MTIGYVPRVTQLDALQLDDQVADLFKQYLFEATKFLDPGILQPILPELDLALRTLVFKYSLCHNKTTFGQQMLSLKYNEENLTMNKLLWYYGYTIGLKYMRDRAMHTFTSNTIIQSYIQRLETFQIIGDVLNFMRFIQSGKHPSVIDFILNLEITADKITRENLTDFSWTRELLWHNFIELIGTVISLVNIFGLKKKITCLLKYVPWNKQHIPASVTSASMNLKTVCAFCSYKPILPHTMGCSHIFCYYCLAANKCSDEDFSCPKCFYNGKEIKRFVILKD